LTRAEFDARADERCRACGNSVMLEDNPNNGATQVVCRSRVCRLARRPWGQVVNIKKTTRKTRPPLPDGETLDSIWEKFGNRCVLCSAPKSFLLKVGIGRQVHHVAPYAQEGHRGPLIPICTQCHIVANERQRLYWFFQRVVSKTAQDGDSEDEVVQVITQAIRRPARGS
jgi:ribosomal protein S14